MAGGGQWHCSQGNCSVNWRLNLAEEWLVIRLPELGNIGYGAQAGRLRMSSNVHLHT
ncbi:hypothetical protein Micbo1qcDRAFT_161084, partial [Microdochium bolleyi]